MTTKTSPDELVEALGALKPVVGYLDDAWDAGRRERSLQRVCARAVSETCRFPVRPWVGWLAATTALAGALAVVLFLVPGGLGESSDAARLNAGYALYEATSEQHAYLTDATEELTGRCMADAGLSYWPMPTLPDEYRSPAQPLSVEDARAAGYAAFLLPPAPGELEREAYLDGLSPSELSAYNAVLDGAGGGSVVKIRTAAGEVKISLGGCRAHALEQLFPAPDDLKRFLRLDFEVSNLAATSAFAPEADPALAAATRDWSRCMRSRGRSYADLRAAAESAGEISPDPTSPPPEAIAIAVDDAICRAETGWDAANAEAVRNALGAAANSLEDNLLAYQDLAAAGAARADELLDS
jgi:hypothetical protein